MLFCFRLVFFYTFATFFKLLFAHENELFLAGVESLKIRPLSWLTNFQWRTKAISAFFIWGTFHSDQMVICFDSVECLVLISLFWLTINYLSCRFLITICILNNNKVMMTFTYSTFWVNRSCQILRWYLDSGSLLSWKFQGNNSIGSMPLGFNFSGLAGALVVTESATVVVLVFCFAGWQCWLCILFY